MNKRDKLRRRLRQRRRELSVARQRMAAHAAARMLRRQPWFSRIRSLAAYVATQGELDPLPLLASLQSWRKCFYLPVLRPQQKGLWFRRWNIGEPMYRNRYGIAEPGPDHPNRPAWTLDAILVPLVGFDRKGNRLGMGGGYYDRTLAFQHNRWPARKPLLIGYGYEFQQVRRLKPHSWDIPLDFVVTEARVYHCNAQRPLRLIPESIQARMAVAGKRPTTP